MGRQKKIELLVEKHLDHSQFEHQFIYTSYAGHAISLAKEASIKSDIVVAVGGDGSINETAKGLLGSACYLGIIPCGSGNGLARHLKIPLNPEEAIKKLNHSQEQEIDIIQVNNDHFFSIAGVGFDAYVAKAFSIHHRRGFLGYLELVCKSYFQYESQAYQIKLNEGQLIEKEAFFIAIANSNQFGYNTQITPKAKLDDGKMDICIVKKPSLAQIPEMTRLLFTGKFNLSNLVEYHQVQKICIYRNKDRFINIDGESKEMDEQLSFEVIPEKLKILIP